MGTATGDGIGAGGVATPGDAFADTFADTFAGSLAATVADSCGVPATLPWAT
ncbi:hypothetical protein PSAC2689_10431 [Paraburkholderia sacchari]|uniref:hypothetical protein n=1 Tax=Paraburkholderia sacchari TaxID=159450 RepID=UPI0039A5B7C8